LEKEGTTSKKEIQRGANKIRGPIRTGKVEGQHGEGKGTPVAQNGMGGSSSETQRSRGNRLLRKSNQIGLYNGRRVTTGNTQMGGKIPTKK